MDKIKRGNTISFEAKFDKLEKFSSQFSKAKAIVAYHGKNRNGTYISKEVFEEKLIPTIYGIPVVGEWKEAKEDFGSHGGKLEITDEGMEYIDTTKPYGFVDSSSNVRWETIQEENGVENEYLVADVFLWTARYPEIEKVLNGTNNQSMEIEVFDVDFSEEDYVAIKDAEFSALCVLGEDVEPCFESAKISQFNLDKESFKSEFSLMVQELKNEMKEIETSNNFEGGENVAEKHDITKEEEVVVDEIQDEVVEDEFVENESESEDTNFEDEGKDESSENESKEDVEEKSFEEDKEDESEDVEPEEEFENDESESDSEDSNEETEDFESKYNEIKEQFENLQNEYNALAEEVETLREFKASHDAEVRKEQEEELFNAFSSKLSDKEIDEVRQNASEMTLDEIEKELYVLAGKKVVSFSFDKTKKKNSIVIPVEKEKSNVVDEDRPYAHLLED